MTQIRIMALRHSAFYSPLLMTICGGYLAEEGLEPHYEVASPERTVPDGLRDGTVHLAQSAVATSFAALERGETCNIMHFAQINERDGFFIAARKQEKNFAWTHLFGKQILVDHFFQPLAMFRYALHEQGISEDAITVIDAGGVEAIDRAFREGRGDYVHQQGPLPQQLQKDGRGWVVASVGEVIGPVAFSSLCATRDWLATDMAHAFMRAYRKARAHVIEAPAEDIAAQQAVFFPTIDRNVLADTIRTYQGLGCWPPDPRITREAYDKLLEVFLHSGSIQERHPYEACVAVPPDEGR